MTFILKYKQNMLSKTQFQKTVFDTNFFFFFWFVVVDAVKTNFIFAYVLYDFFLYFLEKKKCPFHSNVFGIQHFFFKHKIDRCISCQHIRCFQFMEICIAEISQYGNDGIDCFFFHWIMQICIFLVDNFLVINFDRVF